MTRLPQTIFIETNRYEGFKLAATLTGKDGKDNDGDGKMAIAEPVISVMPILSLVSINQLSV